MSDNKVLSLVLDGNKVKPKDTPPPENEEYVKDISIKFASNGFCVSVQYSGGSPDDVWLFGDKGELLEFLHNTFN